MAYGNEISDAYPDFWFAGGLFALAVAADKKIHAYIKGKKIYSNLYMVTLGRSGTRKSSVVEVTESTLDAAIANFMDAKVPTEFSPEAFIEHMDEFPHATWMRDEASSVLSLMKRDYMRSFKDTLTHLYGCGPISRKLRTGQRKSKTHFKVEDPYLNVLFATTNSKFASETDSNDKKSGFLARFTFICPTGDHNWMPLDEGDEYISDLETVIIEQLRVIVDRSAAGRLYLGDASRQYWIDWQRKKKDEALAAKDEFKDQISTRCGIMVLKVAMLLEYGSADFDLSKPLRVEFMEEACRLYDDYFEPSAMKTYEAVGSNADKNYIDMIVSFLREHGGEVTANALSQGVKIRRDIRNEYLETLVEDGTIEIVDIPSHGKGRPGKLVRLLKS
jgi:hypothetical protein